MSFMYDGQLCKLNERKGCNLDVIILSASFYTAVAVLNTVILYLGAEATVL